MGNCGEYNGSKIVNKIVYIRQINSNQLFVNLLGYISRAREANLEHQQVQKILECVNILNFLLPPPHWRHSYCHFLNCFGTWGSKRVVALLTFSVSPSCGYCGLRVTVSTATEKAREQANEVWCNLASNDYGRRPQPDATLPSQVEGGGIK